MFYFIFMAVEAIGGFGLFLLLFPDSYLMPVIGAVGCVIVGTIIIQVGEIIGGFIEKAFDIATDNNSKHNIEVSFDVNFDGNTSEASSTQPQLMTVKCPYCGKEWMITENTVMVNCSACNNDFEVDWS